MVRFAALGVTDKVTVNEGEKVTVKGGKKNAENTVIDCVRKIDASKNGSEKVTVNGSEKVTVNYHKEVTVNETDVSEIILRRTTKKEYEILKILTEKPNATYIELAEKLNVNRKTVYIRLKSLRDKGLLIREGADKKGAWRIVLY